MSSPSVSYSITVRLEMPAQPAAVSTISTMVEHASGVVTAVDVSASEADRLQVDVTCATGGEDDAKHVVDALGTIEGVVIGRVSDRTFLAHLGGKIEIQPKMQIRHRDDLSLIYTPGVGRVSQQLAAHPEDAVRLTIKR
ncbi:MAG TPA: NAD-dependent malic enzyme, partial [Ruania sp.]|nr:NAD-dependent malic enzyme [Ruania sp.]